MSHSLHKMMALGFGAVAIASCSDSDVDTAAVKGYEYADNFESAFGSVDANQDWTMAATVKVNVTVSGGSSVAIFTDKPVYATTKLLMAASTSQSDITFNVDKDVTQVYAVVTNEGKTIQEGYYNIANGAVTISDSPVAKSQAKTRTAANVTKTVANKAVVSTASTFKFTGYGYSDLKSFIADKQSDANFQYWCMNLDESQYTIVSLGWFNLEGTGCWYEVRDWTGPFWDSDLQQNTTQTIRYVSGETYNAIQMWMFDFDAGTNIKLTFLNGVETKTAEPWTLATGYQLFGPEGFFYEQVGYAGSGVGSNSGSMNKVTQFYGNSSEEQLATLQKLEKGFSITTTGGEISLPFIYGATIHTNVVGYVYYKEGEDPLTKPHYTFITDARPNSNIHFEDGTAAGGYGDEWSTNMMLSYWSNDVNYPLTSFNGQYTGDTKVYGTTYKLVYFGENYDEAGDYNFPAGYKIVFFITPVADINNLANTSYYDAYAYNYSLPELNARIGHAYGSGASDPFTTTSVTKQAGVAPEGAVKAVAWKTGGNTFLGFEDGGGDEDLNDVVFWVEGSFNTNETVLDVPVSITYDTKSWIYASEDLGGTYDYDFNDVVWEVSNSYSYNNGVLDKCTGSKLNILAAGGILPVDLYLDGASLTSNIHEQFGQSANAKGQYDPINVGTTTTYQPLTVKTWSEAQDVNTLAERFQIHVTGDNSINGTDAEYVTTYAKNNEKNVPQIILLPGEWEWPTEETPINTAYPNFNNWVKDATWAQWSATKVAGKTTTR